jgi:hypothetical protein
LVKMGDDQESLKKWELETSLLWKGVELDSILDLLQDCPIKEFTESAVVIQAGQPNDFLYLILSGRLRIHLKDLTLAPIVMLEAGEVVGEMSVFDRQPASAYVVAHEDSRLLVLDRATIWSLIEIYPIVARNLLFVLAQRLRSGNALVEDWLLERVSESALGAFPFQSPGSQKETAPLVEGVEAERTPWEVQLKPSGPPGKSLRQEWRKFSLRRGRKTQHPLKRRLKPSGPRGKSPRGDWRKFSLRRSRKARQSLRRRLKPNVSVRKSLRPRRKKVSLRGCRIPEL